MSIEELYALPAPLRKIGVMAFGLLGVLILLTLLFTTMVSPFSKTSKSVDPWLPDILQAAHTYEVDPALVAAIMEQESGGNPNAISHVGAMGLMQLMPDTAKGLGVQNGFDPVQNIRGGAQYLKELLNRFHGNLTDVIAAYNAGPGAVESYHGVPPYPETEKYVASVLGFYQIYQEKIRGNEKSTTR